LPGEAEQASPGQPGTVRDKIKMSKNGHARRRETHTQSRPGISPMAVGRRQGPANVMYI
jgi:hypothetical protein